MSVNTQSYRLAAPKTTSLLVSWPMLLIVALAVAVRIGFWWFQARSGAVPPGDPEEYYRAALHILQGGYHDTGKWLRPPVYPVFLALMFTLGGINLSWALLGQAVVCGLGTLAFAVYAGQLFGRRDIALVSGLVAALFVPLASFGSVPFAEGLFVILIMLGLAALDRVLTSRRPVAALVCGIMLGLAALTRATALMFIPVAAGLVLLVYFLERKIAQQPRSRPLVLVMALALGAALVIGPWATRNYIVHQRLILSDTNGGISLWFGTIKSEEEQQAGEARLWAVPNLADRQALATQMARENILHDPAWFIGRMRFKIASLYLLQSRSYAVGDVITISPQDEQVALGGGENPLRLTLIADIQYVLIMLFGIAGFCYAPDKRRILPALAWILVATLMSAVTIGHPRLRLPIVAALIPFCAYAIMQIPAFVRAICVFFVSNTSRSQDSRRSGEKFSARGFPSRSPIEPEVPLKDGISARGFPSRAPSTGDGAAQAHDTQKSEEENSARGDPSRSPGTVSSIGYRLSSINYRLSAIALLAGWALFLALIVSTRYLAWFGGERYAYQARAALAQGGIVQARTLFEQARAADPGNALRVIALADLAFQERDFPAAVELYAAALALEERSLYAHAMRAQAAIRAGLPDIARTEQAALAGYGRDNNEVYEWAWGFFTSPPPARIVPGDALALGHYAGFAPATPELTQGRWTLGDGRLRLQGSCNPLILKLQGPPGRTVQIEIEDFGITHELVLDGSVQTITIPLGTIRECEAGPIVVVHIRSATGLLDLEQAPWAVGVAVLEAFVA